MRKAIFISFVFLLTSVMSFGQESTYKVGDVFLISEVENNSYQYINFPKDNFIIKKGGIPNYKNVKGKKVVVTKIKEKSNGTKVATLSLLSNKYFFNSHKFITVQIENAIEEKELVKI